MAAFIFLIFELKERLAFFFLVISFFGPAPSPFSPLLLPPTLICVVWGNPIKLTCSYNHNIFEKIIIIIRKMFLQKIVQNFSFVIIFLEKKERTTTFAVGDFGCFVDADV